MKTRQSPQSGAHYVIGQESLPPPEAYTGKQTINADYEMSPVQPQIVDVGDERKPMSGNLQSAY
jgi:hypothetical protein